MNGKAVGTLLAIAMVAGCGRSRSPVLQTPRLGRLAVNIGIVLAFAAFYQRFLKRS